MATPVSCICGLACAPLAITSAYALGVNCDSSNNEELVDAKLAEYGAAALARKFAVAVFVTCAAATLAAFIFSGSFITPVMLCSVLSLAFATVDTALDDLPTLFNRDSVLVTS